MARTKLTTGPIVREIDTIIHDAQGREILRVGMTETTFRHADGTFEILEKHESLTLADGSNWSPAMLLGNKPAHVGCCALCNDPPRRGIFRERPSAGLVRLSRAKTCAPPCGKLLCPRHRKLCSDGVWRCLRCARRYALKTAIKSIFFERR